MDKPPGDPRVLTEITEDRATLSVEEAGQRLGISRNLAYDQVAAGRIPSIRLGRRIVIPRLSFERWLATVTPAGSQQP